MVLWLEELNLLNIWGHEETGMCFFGLVCLFVSLFFFFWECFISSLKKWCVCVYIYSKLGSHISWFLYARKLWSTCSWMLKRDPCCIVLLRPHLVEICTCHLSVYSLLCWMELHYLCLKHSALFSICCNCEGGKTKFVNVVILFFVWALKHNELWLNSSSVNIGVEIFWQVRIHIYAHTHIKVHV